MTTCGSDEEFEFMNNCSQVEGKQNFDFLQELTQLKEKTLLPERANETHNSTSLDNTSLTIRENPRDTLKITTLVLIFSFFIK